MADYSVYKNDRTICFKRSNETAQILFNGTRGFDVEGTPLETLPFFFQQVTVIVFFMRLLVFFFTSLLKQPRFVPEMLGGVLVYYMGEGGRRLGFILFPLPSWTIFETLASLGLLYFCFLAGLEIDRRTLRRPGRKVAGMVGSGIVVSYILGWFAYGLLSTTGADFVGRFICGAALSVTGAAALTQILTELKLLNVDISTTAMKSAITSEMYSWAVVPVCIVLATGDMGFTVGFAVVATVIFGLVCFLSAGTATTWIMRRTPEGESVSNFHVSLVLVAVLVAGAATDACGTHSITGAFLLGLAMPRGMLATAVTEKLENFIADLFVPLFCCVCGARAGIEEHITKRTTWLKAVAIVASAFLSRVAFALAPSFALKIVPRDGMALGALLNAKGLVALIIVNIGWELSAIETPVYVAFFIAIGMMTFIITPILQFCYKPTRRSSQYKHRTMEGLKPDTQLRIVACIYSLENIPGIIKLLEMSHATKLSPICVFALHLIELTGRTSAMLIVHSTRKSGGHNPNHSKAQGPQLVEAFEKYEQRNEAVSVQPLTAISPYAEMHEDICDLAEEKRVSFLIVPFHMQQKSTGEEENPVRCVNTNVLELAPCSVGIFVDRGLGEGRRGASRRVAVLFFGGFDDREALTYALRMAEHPTICLTVVRFVLGEGVDLVDFLEDASNGYAIETLLEENQNQKQLDDALVNEFRLKAAGSESLRYLQEVSNNGEETVTLIKSMDRDYDLYVVGKGERLISPLTAGLNEWSDSPELGPIGDMLVTSDFASKGSVLVVQQYADGRGGLYHSQSQREPLNRPDML